MASGKCFVLCALGSSLDTVHASVTETFASSRCSHMEIGHYFLGPSYLALTTAEKFDDLDCDKSLRIHVGRNPGIMRSIMKSKNYHELHSRLYDGMPRFLSGKNVVIMICKSGRHRSVANAELWSNTLTRYGRLQHTVSLLHLSELDFWKIHVPQLVRNAANHLPESSTHTTTASELSVHDLPRCLILRLNIGSDHDKKVSVRVVLGTRFRERQVILDELAERLGNLHESAPALADCLQTCDVTRKTDLSMIEAAKCLFHKLLGKASDNLERVTPQLRENLHAETTRNKRRCSRSDTPSLRPCSRSETPEDIRSRSETSSCTVELESASKTRPSLALKQVTAGDFRKQRCQSLCTDLERYEFKMSSFTTILNLLFAEAEQKGKIEIFVHTLDLDQMVRVQTSCLST